MLERLFRLIEETHVLDRDHRLVGEGLEQVDLPLREGRGFGSRDGNRPDRCALVQHRHGQEAPEVYGLRDGLEPKLGIFTDVRNVDDIAG